jgi:hypothetical protein
VENDGVIIQILLKIKSFPPERAVRVVQDKPIYFGAELT